MKAKKMLEELSALLDADKMKIVKKKKKIKSLLKQLKQERRLLKAELETEQDIEKARQLRRKLKIIKLERRKGIDLLKKFMDKDKS